jgi:hypothetical protein
MTPLNLTPTVAEVSVLHIKLVHKYKLERYDIIFRMMNILDQYTMCHVLHHPV